jgi:hypothetical protein
VHSPVRCAAAALPAARQRSTAAPADTRSSVDVGLAVVGPRLAVLFFVEHQLVVRVVIVIKVVVFFSCSFLNAFISAFKSQVFCFVRFFLAF